MQSVGSRQSDRNFFAEHQLSGPPETVITERTHR